MGLVMWKYEVVAHFGSVIAVAKALGIKSAAVSQWPDRIPMRRAYELERLTNGALKVQAGTLPEKAA